MARVILSPFIKSISGRVGNLEFRTLKSGKTVVHACGAFIPKKAKERAGIYTLEEALALKLSIIREFN